MSTFTNTQPLPKARSYGAQTAALPLGWVLAVGLAFLVGTALPDIRAAAPDAPAPVLEDWHGNVMRSHY